MSLLDSLSARETQHYLKRGSQPIANVDADASLEAVDQCLAAAAYSLKFDIAELWKLLPDNSTTTTTVKRSSAGQTRGAPSPGSGGFGKQRPTCAHVYTMPATLKTYTGRLAGIWSTRFDDSRAPQEHLISPRMCEQARASECPLWFTSTPARKLHPSLPINTAVVLPVHLEADSEDEDGSSDYIAVFLSLTLHEKNPLSLDFLGHISKAAVSLLLEHRARAGNTLRPHGHDSTSRDPSIETYIRDLSVVAHPGGRPNVQIAWSELSNILFLVDGSRCTVYTATYKDQPVVVKLMRKDVQDAAMVRHELEVELALLLRFRHENIVRLLGAGSQPERFLVMALLDGGTLAQRCIDRNPRLRDRRGRFKAEKHFSYMELLRCARQLAEALRYLHEEAIPGKMVIHRDLKPDNIGFTTEGDVKLLDLGLSRVVSKSEMDDATYEMSGEIGSARYRAPEVAESRPYNEKVDVYSYAILLWEMTTLRKPYDGMGHDQLIARVVRDAHRPPLNKKWPKPWSELMQACWAEAPAKRPSFARVVEELQGMLQDGIDQNLRDLLESPS